MKDSSIGMGMGIACICPALGWGWALWCDHLEDHSFSARFEGTHSAGLPLGQQYDGLGERA